MSFLFLSLASICYVVPFFRVLRAAVSAVWSLGLAGSRAGLKTPRSRLASCLAEWEYYLAPLRLFLVFLPLLVALIVYVAGMVRQGLLVADGPEFAWLFVLNVLQFLHSEHCRRTQIRFVELLRVRPRVHPGVFFGLYKMQMAWGGAIPGPDELQDLNLVDADFRKKQRPQLKFWPVVRAVFDTITVAGFILRAGRDVGEDYARDISDSVGVLLGKRILQYAEANLVVTGQEKLTGKSGHYVIISNHKSSLDFLFAFFVLSEAPVAGRSIKPRFIVAKDHFRDNPWIYHVMGVGRAIEIMNMIFIERKDRNQGFANLKEAARTVVTRDVDVAIYPQGTRAIGNFDRAGKRRDAGYYTTVSRHQPDATLSHLKKGTGYLVFDILDELLQQGRDEQLHLVFLGITGAATSFPKGAFTLQTENTIEFHVGDVVTLVPNMLHEIRAESPESDKAQIQADFARKLNTLIDDKLKESIGLHLSLSKRFLTDLKGHFQFDEDKIQVISQGLDKVSRDSDVAYKILDRVYSLKVTEWNGYLSQLGQLLMGRLERERFESLLQQVTQALLHIK